MRLLSHNLLMCNVKNCDKNNFPLGIYVEKSQIIECEFRIEALKKLIPKLAWPALVQTVLSLGNNNFPAQVTPENLEDENFMKNIHRVIMETHIQEGKLICGNCQRTYPIVNGIPNMILNETEL